MRRANHLVFHIHEGMRRGAKQQDAHRMDQYSGGLFC